MHLYLDHNMNTSWVLKQITVPKENNNQTLID